jgi:hypothetical protein
MIYFDNGTKIPDETDDILFLTPKQTRSTRHARKQSPGSSSSSNYSITRLPRGPRAGGGLKTRPTGRRGCARRS